MSTYEVVSGIGLKHEHGPSGERRQGVIAKLQAKHAERRANLQAAYEAQRQELQAAQREASAFMTNLIDAHAYKAQKAGGNTYEASYTVPEGPRQGETILLSHANHKNKKGGTVDPNFDWWNLQVARDGETTATYKMQLHRPASKLAPELVATVNGRELPVNALDHQVEVGHYKAVSESLALVAQGMRSKELVTQAK